MPRTVLAARFIPGWGRQRLGPAVRKVTKQADAGTERHSRSRGLPLWIVAALREFCFCVSNGWLQRCGIRRKKQAPN